jgi:hypothetical protein
MARPAASLLAATLLLVAACENERTVYRDYPVYGGSGYPRYGGLPGRLEGRPREAVEMCRDRAEDLVRERGAGRAVQVDETDRAREDDDRVEVRGFVRVLERDGGRHRAWIECEVDFEGSNRIVAFREDGLFRRDGGGRDRRSDSGWGAWSRGRDRDREQARGGNLREQASRACRRLAQEQNYQVADVQDRDRTGNGMRLEMRLRRNDRRWDAVCQYNANSGEARFVRLERQRS